MGLTEKLKNSWRSLRHKMIHEKATPEYIARGWALGMFCGCLIPFGFQLYISIPVSFLIKGSKVGATLGTLITNPVTILFIYPFQCWFGARLIGGNLDYSVLKEKIAAVNSLQALYNLGSEIFFAFFAGAAVITLICTPLTYFFVRNIVRKARSGNEKNDFPDDCESNSL